MKYINIESPLAYLIGLPYCSFNRSFTINRHQLLIDYRTAFDSFDRFNVASEDCVEIANNVIQDIRSNKLSNRLFNDLSFDRQLSNILYFVLCKLRMSVNDIIPGMTYYVAYPPCSDHIGYFQVPSTGLKLEKTDFDIAVFKSLDGPYIYPGDMGILDENNEMFYTNQPRATFRSKELAMLWNLVSKVK